MYQPAMGDDGAGATAIRLVHLPVGNQMNKIKISTYARSDSDTTGYSGKCLNPLR